ncbi:hypothetical protein ECANGB1_2622 [Enterospora canceri]|uniref:Uncharacterized protein n=1 Tax=Enterospora canceri TaxID=1081671 RepID=A0A1Y1S9F8_9MICR|nr:hypothetical protein ECANGB1_2622 [Enterospora canceri]
MASILDMFILVLFDSTLVSTNPKSVSSKFSGTVSFTSVRFDFIEIFPNVSNTTTSSS